MNETIKHYDDNAVSYFNRYETLRFEDVHADILPYLPLPKGSCILDVGSGSGRDAYALSQRGYCVLATEPSDKLRALAKDRHTASNIHWLDARLPHLFDTSPLAFDFILVSAVWHLLTSENRQESLNQLREILLPKGRIAVSLRFDLEADPKYTTVRELLTHAKQVGDWQTTVLPRRVDKLQRTNVIWQTVILQKEY